jgi:hypothetical protein
MIVFGVAVAIRVRDVVIAMTGRDVGRDDVARWQPWVVQAKWISDAASRGGFGADAGVCWPYGSRLSWSSALRSAGECVHRAAEL